MTDRRSRIEIGWTSCANCAATVTDALESLDGVSVSVLASSLLFRRVTPHNDYDLLGALRR